MLTGIAFAAGWKKPRMTFGDIPSDVAIKIKSTGRDAERLAVEWKIRIANPNLRVLDASWKRTELAWRVQGHYTPEFGAWLSGVLYDNPRFFEQMNLVPESTISKDCRVLEEIGLFPKPEAKPALQQTI